MAPTVQSCNVVSALKFDVNCQFNEFWEMWLAIFAWMAVSYAVVHVVAFVASCLLLRRHSWFLFISCSFIVTLAAGPTTLGAITSAIIALPFHVCHKPLFPWHCMMLGCAQTLFVALTSFVRILATL